ncbi:MAG: hypothetical protein BJ554DRAFT_7686 [Olpidium bornovanus]|uniref:Uncharacterized protein n=1 Tax=Olpidium bornovanus TaxID=278681 RepID=A0A8H8A1I8_9FUNG|nr:MAG: hypothetical protein BJ554DRAFT_7686 [Olpidium bornovanus]
MADAETQILQSVDQSPELQQLMADWDRARLIFDDGLRQSVRGGNLARSVLTILILVGTAVLLPFLLDAATAVFLLVFAGISLVLTALYLALGVGVDTLCNHSADVARSLDFAQDLRANGHPDVANLIERLARAAETCEAAADRGVYAVLADMGAVSDESFAVISEAADAAAEAGLPPGRVEVVLAGADLPGTREALANLSRPVISAAASANLTRALRAYRTLAAADATNDTASVAGLAGPVRSEVDGGLADDDFEIVTGRISEGQARAQFEPMLSAFADEIGQVNASLNDYQAEAAAVEDASAAASSLLPRLRDLQTEYQSNVSAALDAVEGLDLTPALVSALAWAQGRNGFRAVCRLLFFTADFGPALQTFLRQLANDLTHDVQRQMGDCAYVPRDIRALRAATCTQAL